MKKLVLVFTMFLGLNSFGQTIENNNSESIVSDTINVMSKHLNFTSEYAKEMQTWSKERLEHFNETFVYTRGNFTIPDKPIRPYKP
jgi:hypothetical protein